MFLSEQKAGTAAIVKKEMTLEIHVGGTVYKFVKSPDSLKTDVFVNGELNRTADVYCDERFESFEECAKNIIDIIEGNFLTLCVYGSV